jgi:hypothetical protein
VSSGDSGNSEGSYSDRESQQRRYSDGQWQTVTESESSESSDSDSDSDNSRERQQQPVSQ